jgi:hypothetical protein
VRWDSTTAESFFAALKNEMYYWTPSSPERAPASLSLSASMPSTTAEVALHPRLPQPIRSAHHRPVGSRRPNPKIAVR